MGYIDFELYIKKYVPPQNTLSLLPPNRYFFSTQILGGHVTSCNQGLSSNDQGKQRRESLGARLTNVNLLHSLTHLSLLCSSTLPLPQRMRTCSQATTCTRYSKIFLSASIRRFNMHSLKYGCNNRFFIFATVVFSTVYINACLQQQL